MGFEDLRGVNPPFGRTHHHQPQRGELLLFPAWASHFLTPHSGNTSNVFFNFLLWPPGGTSDFDWEDDILGDYTYSKTSRIRAQSPVPKPEGAAASKPQRRKTQSCEEASRQGEPLGRPRVLRPERLMIWLAK